MQIELASRPHLVTHLVVSTSLFAQFYDLQIGDVICLRLHACMLLAARQLNEAYKVEQIKRQKRAADVELLLLHRRPGARPKTSVRKTILNFERGIKSTPGV
jgi:hypothetical protein